MQFSILRLSNGEHVSSDLYLFPNACMRMQVRGSAGAHLLGAANELAKPNPDLLDLDRHLRCVPGLGGTGLNC